MTHQVTLGPIIIGVTSIENVRDFYVNVFGIHIDHEKESYLSAYLGDTHIEIEEDSENRFPNWAKNNIGTYKNSEFYVKDMSSFLSLVTKNGGKIVSQSKIMPWGNIVAEIADPENNIFLVSQKL